MATEKNTTITHKLMTLTYMLYGYMYVQKIYICASTWAVYHAIDNSCYSEYLCSTTYLAYNIHKTHAIFIMFIEHQLTTMKLTISIISYD